MFKAIFLLNALAQLSSALVCPPAADLTPCTCTETSKPVISCSSIRGRFDIKAHFEKVIPLMDTSVVFEELEIRDTSLFDIPAGTFQGLKFRNIDISSNSGLDYISPDAFNVTEETVDLTLWNNYLQNEPPYELDFYGFLNKFPSVRSIWFPNNRITSIPDNAFGPLRNLSSLYFGNNNVKTIGNNAFSQLSNLTKLYFSFNDLSNEGFAPNAFQGISSTADVDLTYNSKIDYLEEEKFRQILDTAAHVRVGASSCGHNGCSYTSLTCDERADWICKDAEKYEQVLGGFRCRGSYNENVFNYYCNPTNTTTAY